MSETNKEGSLPNVDTKVVPDSITMTYYDTNSMVLDLFQQFKKGYIPRDLNCIARRGRSFTVILIQEGELKRLKREEKEVKQAEIDERTELRRLASLELEAEELTISDTNEDGKELLDDSTKAILDIDWDLLNKKAEEGDKDFIKKIGLKHSVNLSKSKKPEGMVSDFRKALEQL